VFAELSQRLKEYTDLRGERQLGIPWVKNRNPIDSLPYTVFDVETTGLDARHDRVIQLAATPVENNRLQYAQSVNQLMHPGVISGTKKIFNIDPKASAIHGITDADVADKPAISAVLPGWRSKPQSAILSPNRLLVAYNARFDVGFLNQTLLNDPTLKKLGPIPLELVIDPFIILQRLHPFLAQKRTLGTIYTILMGCDLENKHDAQADVDATVDVLKYCLYSLQKHAVTQKQARAAEQAIHYFFNTASIKRQAGTDRAWETTSDAKKLALIAEYIRRERVDFDKYFPGADKEPVRPMDVLNVQFASPARHDGDIAYYPKFDLTFNTVGFDAQKYWDGTDTLDASIVERVRRERADEVKAYLLDVFADGMDLGQLPLARSISTSKRRQALDQLAMPIIDALLKRPRPLPEQLQQANSMFLQATQTQLVAQQPTIDPALQQALIKQTEHLLTTVGNRFLYTYQRITDPKSLIDPAVLAGTSNALDKHNKFGVYLMYQRPEFYAKSAAFK